MYSSIEFVNKKLYVKEINKPFKIVEDFKCEIFIEDLNGQYKILKHNNPIKKEEYSLSEYFDKLLEYKNKNIKTYNAMLPKYQYINKMFYNNKDIINDNIKIFFIKIYCKDELLDKIKVYNNNDKQYYTFYNLNDFVQLVKKEDPAIINYWGETQLYKLVKLFNIEKLSIKELSPYLLSYNKDILIENKTINIEVPRGIHLLNYKDVYKHFQNRKIEKYNLKYIIYKEFFLEEDKYNNINLTSDFSDDKEFEYYVRIDEKNNYMNMVVLQAWDSGVDFNDVFSVIKSWTFKLYNEILPYKIVLPQINFDDVKENYSGGHIYKSAAQICSDMLGIDITSEYPLAIYTNNLSFETILEDKDLEDEILLIKKDFEKKDDKYIMSLEKEKLIHYVRTLKKFNKGLTPSGEIIDNSKDGIIPKLIKKIFNERKKFQQKYKLYQKIQKRFNFLNETSNIL